MLEPAPAEFLGGAEQVPPGSSSTFVATLESGRYVLIFEGYGANGVLKELRVE